MRLRALSFDRRFLKNMLRLALPIALQNLLLSSFTLVDTLMIGALDEVSLASVGMAGKWSWVMTIVFFGFSSGASVFISQYWGNKDLPGIRRSYGVMLTGLLAGALLFTGVAFFAPGFVIGLFNNDPLVIKTGSDYLQIACFSYVGIALSQSASTLLRSTEEVRLPVISSLCAVLVNVVLNYALIFGKFGCPALGVRGAAIATAIAAWVNALVIISIGIAKHTMLRMKLSEMLDWRGGFVWRYIRISFPVLANETLWAVGTMGYDMVFGHMGMENFAALTIARTVQDILFVFLVGVCNACAVMIGMRIGAGEIEEAKQDAYRFTAIMVGLCVVVGAVILVLRAPILSLFNVTDAVRSTAMQLLLIYSLEAWFRNVSYITIVGIFRAGGDTRTGMILDIITVWFIALPVTVIAGLVLKLPFVWVYLLMLLCEDIPKTIYCMRRLISGQWVKPVI